MYATLDYLKTLLPESLLLALCDDDGDGAFITTPPNGATRTMLAAITAADIVINGHLSGRYTVPITGTVPAIVEQISGNLAICNLYHRKRESDVPEGIADRRRESMKLLEGIKAEKIDILELDKTTPSAFVTSSASADRMFPDSLLEAY